MVRGKTDTNITLMRWDSSRLGDLWNVCLLRYSCTGCAIKFVFARSKKKKKNNEKNTHHQE